MSDDIERQMEFIVAQQASFAIDIADLKQVQRQQAVSIDKLTKNLNETRESINETREMIVMVITEMREGLETLIVANEVTRKLAQDIGHL